MTVRSYEYSVEAPPSIVGDLGTGKTVNIQLWLDGTEVTLASSGCTEIGNTGHYSWSTAHIGALPASRVQYHYRMFDGDGNADEGDFSLQGKEAHQGVMPDLDQKTEYLKKLS